MKLLAVAFSSSRKLAFSGIVMAADDWLIMSYWGGIGFRPIPIGGRFELGVTGSLSSSETPLGDGAVV